MVASQPTPPGDPGKAALNHPSSGKGPKSGRKKLLPVDLLSLGNQQSTLGHGEGAYRLHGPAHLLFEPVDESASVMTIALQQLDAGKGVFHWREQRFGSCLIGSTGCQDFDRQ